MANRAPSRAPRVLANPVPRLYKQPTRVAKTPYEYRYLVTRSLAYRVIRYHLSSLAPSLKMEDPLKAKQFDELHKPAPNFKWGRHHAGAKELASGYTSGISQFRLPVTIVGGFVYNIENSRVRDRSCTYSSDWAAVGGSISLGV